ncbi:alpha/beta hydrolase [Dactylosporangium vinaceum]|uniref:Alpha/beta fold hydrolase n=1 Tax=Dactylosporangium vinaceum TaxID=53362 RepID=A0ABV5MRD8_9ACTN|nr:alpha/beta hydrolase [Dactylosporangium vinaceum]UAC00468.1 alpha/beta hydrolase [Dactylosporangium vinaceum]
MSVRTVQHGDVSIAYEEFGSAGDEPMLLIMGLDFQMVWWPDEFIEGLVARGFHVVRFDNRDAGLSTHFTSPRRENLFKVMFRGLPAPAYTTYDMVDDGIAVMDAMGWASAHLLGGSMGSSIALATAVLHPDRVRSVSGVFTAPARKSDAVRYLKVGYFPRLIRHLRRLNLPRNDEGAVQTLVEIVRLMSSPNHPFDEPLTRRMAEQSHARAPRDPSSSQRHLAAGRAAGELNERIGEVRVPTVLINGADDPFIRPGAAAAQARRIPGAKSMVLPAMGHTLPREHWTTLLDTITANARSAVRQ